MSVHDEIIEAFRSIGVKPVSIDKKDFPNETIVIVEVYESDYSLALELISSKEFDSNTIVTVKKSKNKLQPKKVETLLDPKVTDLIELLTSRSRTSEAQPSLHYISGAEEHLRLVKSQRHHLIFGRRGAGKTALMLEAKKQIEANGSIACWINIQTIRKLNATNAFLIVASRLCEIPEIYFKSSNKSYESIAKAKIFKESLNANRANIDVQALGLITSNLQQILHRFWLESQANIFLFLDDFHYLGINEQPDFLDLIHSSTRDTGTWIKATCIKHQSRWFKDNPPTGLQLGHDAAVINLDITLENPKEARRFLENILQRYTQFSGIESTRSIIPSATLDRILLGSGGVPRDFLLLCAGALQDARKRLNPRTTGIQDVNEAAGKAAAGKLQELEDDAASSNEEAINKKIALDLIRNWLLDDKHTTFFRIDFQDKEKMAREYEIIQGLMDLRFIHLLHSNISDQHKAGKKSEVYILDLSQYSGSRLRREINVLDFSKDAFTLRKSGTNEKPKIGDSAKKLVSLLRPGPLLELVNIKESLHGGSTN